MITRFSATGMPKTMLMPQGAVARAGRSVLRGRLAVLALASLLLAAGCAASGGPVAVIGYGGPLPATSGTPSTGTGTGTGTASAPTTAPSVAPIPPGNGGNLATLSGQARSVSTTASATGLSSIRLTGAAQLSATGQVVDGHGHNLGQGTLSANTLDVTVSGLSLELAGTTRVQPGEVTVSGAGITSLGPTTITSSNLMFRPPAPSNSGTAAGQATTTVPPAEAVAGPVTLMATGAGGPGGSGGIQVAGTNLSFVNAPAALSVSSGEADFSWAGTGSVAVAGQTLRATYLGVRAQQLAVSLDRTSAAVAVQGTGLALQAYANGVPQLRVQARIDVLSTQATTGFVPLRHAFVWTPRNLDNTYDMAILSIHPANAAAGGVHLGLLPMPPMFGGEPHALVGGDTAGLKGGDAIDSLVARHGDDKRSIGYDAPAGVPLVLVIQGNFDPITVTVTTY